MPRRTAARWPDAGDAPTCARPLLGLAARRGRAACLAAILFIGHSAQAAQPGRRGRDWRGNPPARSGCCRLRRPALGLPRSGASAASNAAHAAGGMSEALPLYWLRPRRSAAKYALRAGYRCALIGCAVPPAGSRRCLLVPRIQGTPPTGDDLSRPGSPSSHGPCGSARSCKSNAVAAFRGRARVR